VLCARKPTHISDILLDSVFNIGFTRTLLSINLFNNYILFWNMMYLHDQIHTNNVLSLILKCFYGVSFIHEETKVMLRMNSNCILASI